MEIRIRDISPYVLKTIDEEAKKNNLSRQAYLKSYLENSFMPGSQKKVIRDVYSILEKNTIATENLAKILNDVKSSIKPAEKERDRSNVHSTPAINSMKNKMVEHKRNEQPLDEVDKVNAFYDLAKEVGKIND